MWVVCLALLGTTASPILARSLRDGGEKVPSVAAVRAAYEPSDIALLDRHGEVIHELRVDHGRRRLAWTPLAGVSPALRAAVVRAEDRRFFTHGGVDWLAVAAAAVQRLRGGAPRGASTITMQLAALLDPGLRRDAAPRGWRRKWAQARAAWAIERAWTKDEILEAYLNLLTFRGELQGVAAAAAGLFGKLPHGITGAEALVLAALPRAPNAGRDLVLRRAARLGQGVPGGALADLARAVARALDAPPGGGPRVALAPHVAQRLLPPAGPRAPVRSTLDATLQRMVRAALRRQLLVLRPQRVQDGAVLVIDNVSGAVRAYVGSSDELSSARFVDGVRMRRQAGSTLKPFLYGLALDERLLTPASLLADAPLELPVTGGLYRPQNYDERFRGLVTVRAALAGSLNIPAVRTLGHVGAEAFLDRLRRLGFAGLVHAASYYGPSLALGSAEVSLWELAGAYRALANGGAWSPLIMQPDEREDIRNSGGSPAGSDPPPAPALAGRGSRVFSPAAAFLVADILADREGRSATFGLENPLATRFWTAVKTGTSKDMRDNWCVGFSRAYTVAVWVGNFTGEPMRDVSGVSGAAPLWLDIMAWLHRDATSPPPAAPAAVVALPITPASAHEPPRREWFVRGTEPAAPAQMRARPPGRIVAPADGAILALDPDIPPTLQRIVFEASGSGSRWRLDGAEVGTATPYLWDPRAGRHSLALVDARGRELDRVRFAVRGAPAAPSAPRREDTARGEP